MNSIDEILSGDHPRPVVIAHRGASHYHHENTLEAFEAAVEMYAEMVELDVRKTSDGVLVVHHDPDVSGVLISEHDLLKVREIASVDGYALPTLEEVVRYCQDKVPLDIELKEAGFEEQVLDTVLSFLGPEQFLVSSTIEKVIRRIRDLKADIRTGLIISSRPRWQLLTKLFPGISARRSGADVLVVSQKLLRFGFLATTKSLGIPVWVYTVNDRKQMWNLITDERVGGIFTDRPDVALFLRDLYVVGRHKAMPESLAGSE